MNFDSETPSSPTSVPPPPPVPSASDRGSRDACAPRDGGRLFFGLLLVAFGAILFLDRLGLADAGYIFDFWPLIPITFGAIKLASGRDAGERVFGGLMIFFFGWYLLDKLGYVEFEFNGRMIVPLVLMLIGFRVLTRPRRWRSGRAVGRRRSREGLGISESFADAADSNAERAAAASGEWSRADELDAFAVLGALVRGSASKSFRGGKATAVLAGAEIDLRQAQIAGNEATIDTFALWGGIEFIVPREWEVVLNGNPILGGFDDQTRHPNQFDAPRLVITGFAVMGGVSVRNENHRGS